MSYSAHAKISPGLNIDQFLKKNELCPDILKTKLKKMPLFEEHVYAYSQFLWSQLSYFFLWFTKHLLNNYS